MVKRYRLDKEFRCQPIDNFDEFDKKVIAFQTFRTDKCEDELIQRAIDGNKQYINYCRFSGFVILVKFEQSNNPDLVQTVTIYRATPKG